MMAFDEKCKSLLRAFEVMREVLYWRSLWSLEPYAQVDSDARCFGIELLRVLEMGVGQFSKPLKLVGSVEESCWDEDMGNAYAGTDALVQYAVPVVG
jgi:hypothetical protein